MTKLVNVKTFTRGAYWPSGDPRYCTTCSYAGTSRRKQATIVAEKKANGFRLPVAYCDPHTPDQLKGASS